MVAATGCAQDTRTRTHTMWCDAADTSRCGHTLFDELHPVAHVCLVIRQRQLAGDRRDARQCLVRRPRKELQEHLLTARQVCVGSVVQGSHGQAEQLLPVPLLLELWGSSKRKRRQAAGTEQGRSSAHTTGGPRKEFGGVGSCKCCAPPTTTAMICTVTTLCCM